MKQFVSIFLLTVVTAGCSDNQATVDEASKTTVNRKKPADRQSNSIEPGITDVNVDTIGMAEFLALKAAEVADNADGNDINVDTSGFTAFKRSREETARRPCDCEDSIKAERKKYNDSRNSNASTTERSNQQSESRDEAESSDQAQVRHEIGRQKDKKDTVGKEEESKDTTVQQQ